MPCFKIWSGKTPLQASGRQISRGKRAILKLHEEIMLKANEEENAGTRYILN
jgi:hypothetical protein